MLVKLEKMKQKNKQKQELVQKKKEEMSKEKAKETTKEIAELLKNNIKNFWEISKKLKEIRDGKGYKHLGFETFEDYSLKLFELAHRTARAYIQARKYIEKWHPGATFDVDFTKVLLLDRIGDEKYEDKRKELDKKVFNNEISRRDLEDEIKKVTGEERPLDFIKTYNNWNVMDCDVRFGIEYPGRIPGQYIQNILYFFSKKDDKIIDVMSGGGVTNDVVEWYNKTFKTNFKCFSYDLHPARDFIKKNDATNGFPSEAEKSNIIIFDPPYWNIKDSGYKEGSISRESYKEFLKKMKSIFKNCWDTLDDGGLLFLFMMPLIKQKKDVSFDCFKILEELGFKYEIRIQTPLSTQQYTGFQVNNAKENKSLLGISRDMIVVKKQLFTDKMQDEAKFTEENISKLAQ